MGKKSDLLYSVLHIPVDAAAVMLAFIVSYWLRGNGMEIYRLPYNDYLHLVYYSVPIWLILFAIEGLYLSHNLFGKLQNLAKIVVASLAGWASFVVYLTFIKTEATFVFPRLMLIYILLFGLIFVLTGRILLRIVQAIARLFGFGLRNMAILGDGELAKTIETNFKRQPESGTVLIGRESAATPETVAEWAKKHHVDDIIIADHQLGDTKILEYIVSLQNIGVTCHLIPKVYDVQTGNVIYSAIAGYPILTLRQTPLDGWGRIVKRIVDFIVSLISLIVLSPFFLIVGIIIWATDGSPIFYRHTRIARGGQKIQVYKFRSMYLKYCTGGEYSGKTELEIFTEMGRQDLIEEFKRDQKVKNDPRITPIGRFLRKTNIDELPQLINVLKGELSLVGPRPIVTDELARYGRWSSYLLSIKPGITGLWQVSGRSDISYNERVQLDNQYVQNWSLWQDFVIVIKTFAKVLGGGDGY